MIASCTSPDLDSESYSMATDLPYPVKTKTSFPITSTMLPASTQIHEAVESPTRMAQNSTPVPTATKPTFTSVSLPSPVTFTGPLVAFDAINSESEQWVILVIDTASGSGREITPEQLGGTIAGFDWSKNGCELFVAVQQSGGIQYVPVDLNGNVGKPFSQVISSTADEGSRFAWTISPTKKWIAFLLGFGEDEEGFDFGFKDTWVIKNAQEAEAPIALTQNSWTLEPVWSPNGDRLAYTNHDSAGILQLYHSAPDGSDLVQVTHFSESIDHIQGIRWSPDGHWLSFNIFNNEGWPLPPGQSSLWSVDKDGQNLHQAELGDFVIRQSPWWSDDSESYSAYVELWSEEINRGKLDSKVVWVNPQDGTIIHEFAPEGIQFEHVFPVGGNKVIGFLGAKYVVYDKNEDAIHTISESSFEPVFPQEINPLVGPYDFIGESNCK
jgi:hypothetical protein